MKRFAAVAVSLVALVGMTSCGGGGDDVIGSPSGPSAEGYYAGNLVVTANPPVVNNPALPNSSTSFQMLVLENGQFWTFYGTPSGTALRVEGFAQGAGTSNGTLLFASGVKNFPKPPLAGGNAIASVSYNASAKSLSGSITDATSSSTLTSVAQGAQAFSYSTAAALSSVSFAWTMSGLDGDQFNVVIDGAGVVTGTPVAPATCGFTGSVTPRGTGKNVFNVSLTNSAFPDCTFGGLVSTGVAYVAPLVGGGNQLSLATVAPNPNTPSATVGLALWGVRP